MKDKEEGGEGFRKYCQLNSFSIEGLDAIAQYNNYADEWDNEKQLFNANTSLAQQRFIAFKLYAKHRDRRKYHIDQMEGGHRKVANIQANFCSPLDPQRGFLTKPLAYTVNDFKRGGLIPQVDITRGAILGAYNNAINEGQRGEGFFNDTTSVLVRYINNVEPSVPKYLAACRIWSEAIANEKRNSATKDPFVELANHVSKFLRSMSNECLLFRPCLEKFSYDGSGSHRFPGNVAEETLKKASNDLNWKQVNRTTLADVIPLTEFLYTEEFENYCKDPFDKTNEERFMDKLEVPRLFWNKEDLQWCPHDSDKMRPPFCITYATMAIDAGLGNNQRATVEMVNKWCLLPLFIHILQAHKTNRTLVDTARDDKVHAIVLYTMRHHVHKFGTEGLTPQPCMTIVYDMAKVATLAVGDYQVILAALYLAEIVNAALTTIDAKDPDSPDSSVLLSARKKRLKEELTSVTDLYSTLNHYAGHPGIDKMIEELGENNIYNL